MNKQARLLATSAVIVAALAVLPGCKFITDLFKKKDTAKVTTSVGKTGPVLLSINGKNLIWESDFKKSLTQMLQANPYFRGAGINALPMSIKKKFFDELVKQELILRDAENQGVEGKAEFVKAYRELKRLAKRSLVIQFYEKGIFDSILVSDAEKDAHFKDNKDRFVKTPGGILVSGASFDSEKDADNLIADFNEKKVGAKDFLKEFDKMVKDDKDATFKNFGRIGEKAKGFGDETPAPVREVAYALRKLPQVEKVKIGNQTWVVAASDKKETIFFDREEIDGQLANMLKNNKFREKLDKKIKDLQAGTTLEVNEPYFHEATEKTASINALEALQKSGKVKVVKKQEQKKDVIAA